MTATATSSIGHRPAEVALAWGPLLSAVLAAQASSADLLSAERICDSAQLLLRFTERCGSPVLAPVSPMAARLVGAALLLGRETIRATDDGTVPVGEHVLLVEAAAVGPAGLLAAREAMLRAGAARVDVVALHLPDDQRGDVSVLMPPRHRVDAASHRGHW
jgi:hypothetical protein